MLIKLKPQWYLTQEAEDKTRLTSELLTNVYPQSHQALLLKLQAGVDSDDLSDEEFQLLETLNNLGLVASTTDATAPVWEMHGAPFQHVQQQFKHTTIKIHDYSKQQVGMAIRQQLLDAGLSESENPILNLVFTNSFVDIPKMNGVALPIVVGRVRWSMGPYLFPWRTETVADLVAQSPHYMREPNYELPPAFALLEQGLTVVNILQTIALNRPLLVNNTIEHNMITQERVVWQIHQ